jgi:hypothetical protein
MVGMPNSDALCGRQTITRCLIKSAHRAGPEAGATGKARRVRAPGLQRLRLAE